MERKDWAQILVSTIILGGIGWQLNQIFDVKSTLSKVDQRGLATDQRVERIANALPEIGRYIASEETTDQFDTAILVNKAKENDQGDWYTRVMVFDSHTRERYTYSVNLGKKKDQQPYIQMLGSAALVEGKYTNFKTLSTWSRQIGKDITIPSNIDLENSFIMRSTTAGDYIAQLESSLYFKTPEKEIIKERPTNWNELSVYLLRCDNCY